MGTKRVCEACGTPVVEGCYMVNGGDAYYCSTECLRTRYTDEEWSALYAGQPAGSLDDDGLDEAHDANGSESCYTEWEEEEDRVC